MKVSPHQARVLQKVEGAMARAVRVLRILVLFGIGIVLACSLAIGTFELCIADYAAAKESLLKISVLIVLGVLMLRERVKR